jgi:hypothetical protein
MNRTIIFASMLLSLYGAIGCCDKGSNRLDISLDGPWILYQDMEFNEYGKNVAVLVAIAPISATVESLQGNDYKHHHSPQLSTGDGYYISNAFLQKAHIYCLTLDSRCARKGPRSLNSDSYPPDHLLKVQRKNATGTWDWRTASRNQAALILPMPDSFSNDGTWNMRFSPDGDEIHSIGLHLHYANGARELALQSCSDSEKPTVATCNTPVDGSSLTNTGTLRIQMRAPDNDDPCDWHVRNAWEEMFKILSPSISNNYPHIEPAQRINPDGTGKYGLKPCPEDDPHNHDPKDNGRATPGKGTTRIAETSQLSPDLPLTQEFLKQFSENIAAILTVKHEDSSEWRSLELLQKESQTLNPNLPRISQVSLMVDLGRSSANLIDRLSAEHARDDHLISVLNSFKIERKNFQDNANTKNGGDCRAPVVMVE